MYQENNHRFAHPAWIEIDLDQFVKNIEALKAYLPKQKICLAVKANAYGHGIVPIAEVAAYHGVDYLAVAHLQEGALLREAGITIPILVLGAIHEDQLPDLLKYHLEFTISSRYKAELVATLCRKLKEKARIHIEMETGMQRTGMRPETALELIHDLNAKCSKYIEIAGVYSHLASADIPNNAETHEQIKLFKNAVKNIEKTNPDIIAHLASTGGVLHYPDSLFDMVRVGILLFGYTCPPSHPLAKDIKPFFSVKAKISFFKAVEAHKGVGYGHTYHTDRLTRLVTVPAGYGDGIRRSLSNKGQVLIHGQRYPIAGLVCMDQFMVDIDMNEAYVGDEVVIIGQQQNETISLQEIADLANTIPNEILCGFNDRLPRFYKYNGNYV